MDKFLSKEEVDQLSEEELISIGPGERFGYGGGEGVAYDLQHSDRGRWVKAKHVSDRVCKIWENQYTAFMQRQRAKKDALDSVRHVFHVAKRAEIEELRKTETGWKVDGKDLTHGQLVDKFFE